MQNNYYNFFTDKTWSGLFGQVDERIFPFPAELIKKNINFPEAFPEGGPILKRHLCIIGKTIKVLENHIKDVYNNTTYDEITKQVITHVIKGIYLDPLLAHRIRLRREFALYSKRSSHRLDVTKAKDVKIETLFELQKPRRTQSKIFCCCPLGHKDNTPSFCIYLTTNSFHCFSCHEGGDSIVFVQKINNFSFKEAVNFLTKGQV